MEKELKILDKLFQYREEKFIDEIQEDLELLNNRLKDIKKQELTNLINSIPEENAKLKEKLSESIDNLITDYSITMAYYNKKYYKQGFIDATKLVEINKK